MSMPIVAGSEPLATHAAQVSLDLWRAVEAQHRVATMLLVDTLDEQALLESLLDASKPALPESMPRLHWLLFTPFRYPPLPSGSRFRGPAEPGVFYGAEERRAACAELGYWRWRFLMDSPALEAIGPTAQTLFRTPVAGAGIDLRRPPFDARRAAWTDPADYAALLKEMQSAGGALGAAIAPVGSGLLGALLGGAAGAALGQSVDRNNVRCR